MLLLDASRGLSVRSPLAIRLLSLPQPGHDRLEDGLDPTCAMLSGVTGQTGRVSLVI
jgi:hypothetical protein